MAHEIKVSSSKDYGMLPFCLQEYEAAKGWQLVATVMVFFMVAFDNRIRKYQYQLKKSC